jgi:hypothetical protein
MPPEKCEKCGELMKEQADAYEAIDLPGVPKHSARFYEQWFVCPNGHKRAHIAGHGPARKHSKGIAASAIHRH